MAVLLEICCIFSKHLFLRTPLEDWLWLLNFFLEFKDFPLNMKLLITLDNTSICDIISFQVIVFPWKFQSPQAKQDLISIQYNKICVSVASQFAKRLQTQDLWKLGNEKTISKLGEGTAQCSVFSPKTNFLQQQSKLMQMQVSKLSGLVRFYFVFLLFPSLLQSSIS